jgi:hypothetical protein
MFIVKKYSEFLVCLLFFFLLEQERAIQFAVTKFLGTGSQVP